MNNSGYIYALINPSLDGMVKVGKTTRTPEDRASELSSATGVPTPFVVVYDEYFSDITSAEEYVHTLLEHRGYRLVKNREFFTVPIKEVVLALQQAKAELGGASESTDDGQISDAGQNSIIEGLLESAHKYEWGFDDYLEDKDKALELYTNALNLGNYNSYYNCGSINLDHKNNSTKALELFRKGTEKIKDRIPLAHCFESMAEIYETEGHTKNALKCWEKYFSLVNMNDALHALMYVADEADSDAEYVYVDIDSVFKYIETARKTYVTPQYKDVLIRRLQTEQDSAEKQREEDLEELLENGSRGSSITDIHFLLYIVYERALENDDYSKVDEYFPDESWRDVSHYFEVNGEVIDLGI